LKLLFKDYEKALTEFGVRPAPLASNIGMSDFIKWIAKEFKALFEVISGANDFAAAFSAESILKLLHDFDCADLAKFLRNFRSSQMPQVLLEFGPMLTFWH
jgi:hypothetical protein